MISFKRFLGEIFDSHNSFDYQLKYQRDRKSSYHFKDDEGHMYYVHIYSYAFADYVTHDISFDGPNGVWPTRFNNTKTAIGIYNTVGQIAREDLRKKNLKSGDRITFEAVVHKTVPIYQRFAKLIAKEIGGRVDSEYGYRIVITKK